MALPTGPSVPSNPVRPGNGLAAGDKAQAPDIYTGTAGGKSLTNFGSNNFGRSTARFGGALDNWNAYPGGDPRGILLGTAYDKAISFFNRAEPMFRQFASKKPVSVTNPGDTVVFQLYDYLTPDISNLVLNEYDDVDAIALPPLKAVDVKVNEIGAAVMYTEKLQHLSLNAVDPVIAQQIAWHMRDSIDALFYEATFRKITGDQVITANATLDTPSIREAVTQLRANQIEPWGGAGLYTVLCNPVDAHDLRSETGGSTAISAAWRDPQVYGGSQENIWKGTIGTYEGCTFISSPRVPVGEVWVIGQGAFAEAVVVEPHTVVGPMVDKLQRHRSLGWKGMLGWNVYNPRAIIKIVTTPSLSGAKFTPEGAPYKADGTNHVIPRDGAEAAAEAAPSKK